MNAQARALNLPQERQLNIPVISDIFPSPKSTKTKSTDNISSTPSTSSADSTSTTLNTTSSSTSPSSSTSIATTSSPPVVVQTVAGQTITLTSSGRQTPTISPSPSPTPTAFLQNKALSGVVFGLAGLVGLILIIAIAACVIRRRRNKKLTDDALGFNFNVPVGIRHY